MSAASRIQFTAAELGSLVAVLLLAFSASLGMAFNIDAIAISFAVDNASAGLVASAEMAAIAAGNLLSAQFVGRVSAHRVYVFGSLVIFFSNGLSLFAPDLYWLAGMRFAAGAALGVVVAAVMGSAGRSSTPERTFGVINASIGAMGILISFLLPRSMQLGSAVPAEWGFSAADGLYATYTLAAILALVFVRFTPRPAPVAVSSEGADSPSYNRWPPLFGIGLAFFGHALLGIFLVRVGREAGLDAEEIGYVLMLGGAMGITLPLLTGYYGAIVKATPIVVALLVAILALGVVLPHMHGWGYVLIAPVFAALPIAMMPVFLGAAAKVDSSGRLIASHPAFVMLGSAIAPLVGGWLSVQGGGFTLNGYALAFCLLAGGMLMLPILRRADHAARI